MCSLFIKFSEREEELNEKEGEKEEARYFERTFTASARVCVCSLATQSVKRAKAKRRT